MEQQVQGKRYSLKDLQCKGWTPGMIEQLAGDADIVKPNPYYRTAGAMRFWFAARIDKLEATPEFRDFINGTAKRKQGRNN